MTEVSFGYRTAAEIAELVSAFENCTLPASLWTPRSALTLAFWYGFLNPPAEARREFETTLRRYCFEHREVTFDAEEMRANLVAVELFLRGKRHRYAFLELINGMLALKRDEKGQRPGGERTRPLNWKKIGGKC